MNLLPMTFITICDYVPLQYYYVRCCVVVKPKPDMKHNSVTSAETQLPSYVLSLLSKLSKLAIIILSKFFIKDFYFY